MIFLLSIPVRGKPGKGGGRETWPLSTTECMKRGGKRAGRRGGEGGGKRLDGSVISPTGWGETGGERKSGDSDILLCRCSSKGDVRKRRKSEKKEGGMYAASGVDEPVQGAGKGGAKKKGEKGEKVFGRPFFDLKGRRNNKRGEGEKEKGGRKEYKRNGPKE